MKYGPLMEILSIGISLSAMQERDQKNNTLNIMYLQYIIFNIFFFSQRGLMTKKNKKIFSIITISYFLLGFVNIYFSYLALACMVIPFYLLFRDKKNIWCTGVCPRADYLSLFRFINFGKKAPEWLFGNRMKKNLLTYFCLNIMFIFLSSIMVQSGRIAPIDKIRLFIMFQLPRDMPQLWTLDSYSPSLLHLAYRLYSLMLSSTILGTVLAVLYKPRTWCVVCPVKTLSTSYLQQVNTKEAVNE